MPLSNRWRLGRDVRRLWAAHVDARVFGLEQQAAAPKRATGQRNAGRYFYGRNTRNCQRGDKLRGSGSVSGGVAVDTSKCPGSAVPTTPAKPKEFARIILHDSDDTTNEFMGAGNDKELARLVAANHCLATAPVPEEPSPCARYQGCDAGMPVIMCQTSGKQHDRQDTLATTAFWKLFSSL